jgi:hypothetical protein
MPRPFILLALAGLLAAVPGVRPAEAQMELAWDQCPGSSQARSNKAFACQDDMALPMKVVVAFTPPTNLQRFVGYRAFIEISTSANTLPDWWAMQPGGCREGSLNVSISPTGVLGSCQNPWYGAQGAGYSYFETGNSPNRAVLQIACARITATSLSPGTRYYGATLLLDAAHSSGSDGTRCSGCSTEVCIAITHIEIAEELEPGQEVARVTTMTRSSQPNVVTFNARDLSGNACGSSNRSSTWGKIKTTYR